MKRKIRNLTLYFILLIITLELFSQPEVTASSINSNSIVNYLTIGYIIRNFLALFMVTIAVMVLHVVFVEGSEKNLEYLPDFKNELKKEIKRIGFTSIKFSMLFLISIILFCLKFISIFTLLMTEPLKFLDLNLIFFLIPVTLMEEIVFRYGFFKTIRQMKVNFLIAYIIPALIFAAGHFYKNDGMSPVASVIFTFIFGLLMEMLYEGSGWSIYPSWFFHFLNDMASFVILLPRR
ncbi:CPBP family intramembrane glutamic endopeptidase [Athalassotoga sp.]|uniref:CPBP family intramembrane glutamic endopeptidase n=1 Tax=Athalassotoga sp. TaxID=2022597 RepID=UPI003CFCC1E5